MEDWKQRVVDEYKQLHGRYERLSAFITRYESGTLPFTPNCPLCLLRMQGKIKKINLPMCFLRMQADTMRKYLDILEIRSKIEKINLVD